MFEDKEVMPEHEAPLEVDVENTCRRSPVPLERTCLLDRSRANSLSKVERLRNIFSTGMSKSVPKTASSAVVSNVTDEQTPAPLLSLTDKNLARSPFRSGDRPHLRVSDESLQSTDSTNGKHLNTQIANEAWRLMSQRIQQLTSIIKWKDKRIAKLENTIQRLPNNGTQILTETASLPSLKTSLSFHRPSVETDPDDVQLDYLEENDADLVLVQYAGDLIDTLVENVATEPDSTFGHLEDTNDNTDDGRSLLEANQNLRLEVEEQSALLNEMRTDLWCVTIQYEELEEAFELSNQQLSEAYRQLREGELSAKSLETTVKMLEEDCKALQAKLDATQTDTVQPDRSSRNLVTGATHFLVDVDCTGDRGHAGTVAVPTASEEVNALKFALEEANYCKTNLETELIKKNDLLSKADYSTHVLRSMMEHADRQRKFLEGSLASQTGNLVALRSQVEQSYVCQRSLEAELASRNERWNRAECEILRQIDDLHRLKLDFDNAQTTLKNMAAELTDRQTRETEACLKLSQATAEIAWYRTSMDGFKGVMTQMEDQLSVKDTEIHQAKEEITVLHFEVQQVRSLKSCLEKELSAVSVELEKVTEKYHTAQLRIATVQDDNANLESQLRQATDRLMSIESDKDVLRKEQSRLMDDKSALEKDLTETFNQTREINHEKVFLRSQLDLSRQNSLELEGIIEKLETEKSTFAKELERALNVYSNSRFIEAAECAEQSRRELACLQAELDECLESEGRLKESLSEKLTDLTDAETTIATLRNDLVTAGHSNQNLSEELAIGRLEKISLQEAVHSLQENCSALEINKSRLEDEISALEDSLEDWESQRTKHREREAELADEIGRKKEEISETELEITELRRKMEHAAGDMEAQLKKSQAELHQARNEIEYFRSRIAELESKNEGAEKRLAELAKDDQLGSDLLEALVEENRVLRESLEKVTDKAEGVQNDLIKAKNIRQAMERELQQVNVQLEKLNAVLEMETSTTSTMLFGTGNEAGAETANVTRSGGVRFIVPVQSDPVSQTEEDNEEVTIPQIVPNVKRAIDQERGEKFRRRKTSTEKKPLMSANLSEVRTRLQQDLQDFRESSRRVAIVQENLLGEILQDLSKLSANFLKKDIGAGKPPEEVFRRMTKKLAAFAESSVHQITDEAEKSTLKLSKVLRRNIKLIDAIIGKFEDMDQSATAYEMLSSGVQSYTQMTKELKGVILQLANSRSAKSAQVKVPNIDLTSHLTQLQQILAAMKSSERSPCLQHPYLARPVSSSVAKRKSYEASSVSRSASSERSPNESQERVRVPTVLANEELKRAEKFSTADLLTEGGTGKSQNVRRFPQGRLIKSANIHVAGKTKRDGNGLEQCTCPMRSLSVADVKKPRRPVSLTESSPAPRKGYA